MADTCTLYLRLIVNFLNLFTARLNVHPSMRLWSYLCLFVCLFPDRLILLSYLLYLFLFFIGGSRREWQTRFPGEFFRLVSISLGLRIGERHNLNSFDVFLLSSPPSSLIHTAIHHQQQQTFALLFSFDKVEMSYI